MFTGIIEEIGMVRSIDKIDQGAVISIYCCNILDDLKIGDSIAVDGACQSVVNLKKDGFDVEASAETLNLTTFEHYKSGTKVNLERAMEANEQIWRTYCYGTY